MAMMNKFTKIGNSLFQKIEVLGTFYRKIKDVQKYDQYLYLGYNFNLVMIGHRGIL